MYIYELSKRNLKLSCAEVLLLADSDIDIEDSNIIDNYLFLDKKVNFERLAYTRNIYELLFACEEKELPEKLEHYDFNKLYKNSFRLRTHYNNNHHNNKFDERKLADIIWNNIKNSKVDMKHADTKIDILFLKKKAYVTILIHEQAERFEERRAHLRPYNHPSSLHPRLARCMVNLAHSNDMLDPFCGSGGILIEAGIIGLEITGFDLHEDMVERARKNLEHFNIKNFQLGVKDALTLDKDFEAIVSDLPYGKNTKSLDLEKTYFGFLLKAREHTSKMVVGFPGTTDNEELLEEAGWNIKYKFEYFIHKNMKKEIYVLSLD